ncbi:MAG: hypothetical protein FJ292_01950 [Planctomycetes bacterium]|nr:hypothetical protein [Planctomycetota bacterium]
MTRLIPLWIAIVSGVAILVSAFIRPMESWGENFTDTFNVIAAIASVLGAGSLLKANLAKVSRRDAGWGFALVVLGTFLITLVVGLGKIGVHPSHDFPQADFGGKQESADTPFGWIYEFAMVPLTSTMFALLAFYVASAAFRAFRAKNLEASLLLGTAFVILLGRTFAGVVLTGWLPDWASGLRLENLSVYVMQVFNTAGNRAIIIGIALGVAATSLRILLGVDRSWLGGGER